MKRIMLAASLLVACGSKTPPPSSPAAPTPTAPERTPDGLKTKAASLRERACACTDDACGAGVKDELATWTASVGTPMSSDPAVEQQLQVTVNEIDGCIRRAAGEK